MLIILPRRDLLSDLPQLLTALPRIHRPYRIPARCVLPPPRSSVTVGAGSQSARCWAGCWAGPGGGIGLERTEPARQGRTRDRRTGPAQPRGHLPAHPHRPRARDPRVGGGRGAFKARRACPLSPASRPFLLARSAISFGSFDSARSLIGPAGVLLGTVSQ